MQSPLTRWRLMVRDHPGLTPTGKLVAYTLDTYMDSQTLRVHHVSYETLARGAGKTTRTINRAIKELEDAGILKASRGRFKGSASGFLGVLTPITKGVTHDTLRSQRVTPMSPEGDTHVTPTYKVLEGTPPALTAAASFGHVQLLVVALDNLRKQGAFPDVINFVAKQIEREATVEEWQAFAAGEGISNVPVAEDVEAVQAVFAGLLEAVEAA